MKIRLEPSVGALIEVIGTDGTVLDNAKVAAIEITPFFTLSSATAEAVVGQAISEARGVVDKFVLTASGRTGHVARSEVVGDVKADEAIGMVAATFGALPSRPAAGPSTTLADPVRFPAPTPSPLTSSPPAHRTSSRSWARTSARRRAVAPC